MNEVGGESILIYFEYGPNDEHIQAPSDVLIKHGSAMSVVSLSVSLFSTLEILAFGKHRVTPTQCDNMRGGQIE